MKRAFFNLRSIELVRSLRTTTNRSQLRAHHGVDENYLEALDSCYRGISDRMLARIHRLLVENERLRRFIAEAGDGVPRERGMG